MDHSLCLLRNSVDAAAVSNENDANASSSSNKLSLGVDTTLKTRIAKQKGVQWGLQELSFWVHCGTRDWEAALSFPAGLSKYPNVENG
ncbi:hypothetical protein V6N11_043011 [Hibiscus sabdariffa]|uniref:Uncharacterized protein n=1 Tax=Hibiscus sabdariffa TaxID=183260 RepID=A0ABR2QY93_9ROSI